MEALVRISAGIRNHCYSQTTHGDYQIMMSMTHELGKSHKNMSFPGTLDHGIFPIVYLITI